MSFSDNCISNLTTRNLADATSTLRPYYPLASPFHLPCYDIPTIALRYANDIAPKEHLRSIKGRLKAVDSVYPRCRQAVAILLSKPRSRLGVA